MPDMPIFLEDLPCSAKTEPSSQSGSLKKNQVILLSSLKESYGFMPLEEQLVLSSSEDEDDVDETPDPRLRSDWMSLEEQLALSSSDEEEEDKGASVSKTTTTAAKDTCDLPKAPVAQQPKKEATLISCAHLAPVATDLQQCQASKQKAEQARQAKSGATHPRAASKPKEAFGSRASKPKAHQVRQARPSAEHLSVKKSLHEKEEAALGKSHGRTVPLMASRPAAVSRQQQQQQSKAAKLKEEARKARGRPVCPSISLKRPAPVSEDELQRKNKMMKRSQEVTTMQKDSMPALRNSRRPVPGCKSLPYFVQAVLPVRRICREGNECTPFVSSTGVKCTICRQRMAFRETERKTRTKESFLVKVFIEKCTDRRANGRTCSYTIQRDGFACRHCRNFTTVKEV